MAQSTIGGASTGIVRSSSGVATTAVTSVPWTTHAATSIPAPAVPEPPEPNEPPRSPAEDRSATGLVIPAGRIRPLPRLRIGRHVASEPALEHIRLSALGVGLTLGWDKEQRPITVRLFRQEPTRVALVGGLWITRIIAVRALALGALVAIFSSRPEAWQGFDDWATGGQDRIRVLPPEHRITVRASPLCPVLFVYDAELLAPPQQPNLAPWQAQLTVLRQLTAYGLPTVQESNLTAAQRLGRDEAVATAAALGLRRETVSWLQMMPDEVLALLAGGIDEYVSVAPTQLERARFGRPVTR
jgi:hypothetical protein